MPESKFKPLKLYHYKKLQTKDHIDWLKKYIEQQVWMTPLDQVNDPFERKYIFQPSEIKDISEEKILFDQFTEKFPNMPKEAKTFIKKNPKEFAKMISSPNNFEQRLDKLAKKKDDDIKNFLSTHGVFSLTKDISNIPMWAHYGDFHQGYSLILEVNLELLFQEFKREIEKTQKVISRQEFEKILNNFQKGEDNILCELPESNLFLTKVKYEEKLPEISNTNLIKKEKKRDYYQYIVNNTIAIKYKQWSYEEEYRLITSWNSDDHDHYLFLPSLTLGGKKEPLIKITGIILGEKFGQNLDSSAKEYLKHLELNGFKFEKLKPHEQIKEYVEHLAKKQKLNIHDAKCCDDKYEIKINPAIK